MQFTELNLHPDLQRGLDDAGYVTCMPVQESVFAHSFSGGDIYAQSQTGTGKTAAFLISIYQRIMASSELRAKKALILAPTRELAVQIETEARRLGKYLPVSTGAFYGGVSYGPQVDMLKADVQVIIGTPGRIIDLLKQGKMLLKEVGFLVIDEADRMFDMGFIDDLRRLLRYLPQASARQTFLFSATLGLRVKDLAWEYMDRPKEIVIEPEHVTVELVTQELYHTGNHEKFRLLLGLLAREAPRSALIFCNQKYMVEELAKRLRVNGVECEFIMGDLPQARRLEIIDRLKAGKLEILVATDVAARGLDVEALDLVVNYDVPEDPESYVHRIGRTARAGKAGKAVTLACEKFVYGLPAIEKFIGAKIPTMPFEEALLLEDKSAGMRFGRAHGRDLRSPGRGAPLGRRDGRREGRPEVRRGPRDERAQRGDRAPQQRPAAARPPLHGRVPARPERTGAAQRDRRPEGSPYSLSQEERMRRYREKYGARAPAAGEEQRKGDERPAGSRDQRQDSRSGPGNRPVPTNPQAYKGRPAAVVPAKPPLPPASREAIRPAAQGKPGIFDRLKHLFGRRKRDR